MLYVSNCHSPVPAPTLCVCVCHRKYSTFYSRRIDTHTPAHPICMTQYPNSNLRYYAFGTTIFQSIFDPAPFLSVSHTNCTPHRCAALLSLTSICVHRARHVLGHIRAFDSKLIVYKLLVHGSRAYRQRQLRISHRLFFLFN